MAQQYSRMVEELIKTCRDGEIGYAHAVKHAKDPHLRARFEQISGERKRFANELEHELALMDRAVNEPHGHAAAAVHRAWIDMKEALGAGDHELLVWLEQGDDYAKQEYERVLEAKLPETVKSVVQRQYQSVLSDHDEIKTLRDTSKAA